MEPESRYNYFRDHCKVQGVIKGTKTLVRIKRMLSNKKDDTHKKYQNNTYKATKVK